MSNVRQYQRRALESLRPKSQSSLIVSENDEYYLKQRKFFLFVKKTRIFFLGVSDGVGTCSDLHGINIAVFGTSPLSYPPFIYKKQKSKKCEWAALLQISTEKEIRAWFQQHGTTCCLTVQRLKVVKQGTNSICFRLTKDKKVYADTI